MPSSGYYCLLLRLKVHGMPTPLFVTLLIAMPVLLAGMSGDVVLALFGFLLVLVANPIIRIVRKNFYFASEHFRNLKSEIESVVEEHNEVVSYVHEIRSQGSFQLGASSSGQYAHLVAFENSSSWNNRRDRNVADYVPHVHNASLQVVRSASAEPIKYFMKYFGVKADTASLADVQRVSADISRLEEAVANVKDRENAILAKIDPPAFIVKHYSDQFWNQVGAHLSPIQVPYPVYRFQYTSAGGNTGQTTTVQLDTPTLEALSATLVDKIRWTKSAAGQRALMTARLRGFIKERDRYTCLRCGVTLASEPHLLLEVDHITPVSKGGLSTIDNLQTLCWRCNRSKGARVGG